MFHKIFAYIKYLYAIQLLIIKVTNVHNYRKE